MWCRQVEAGHKNLSKENQILKLKLWFGMFLLMLGLIEIFWKKKRFRRQGQLDWHELRKLLAHLSKEVTISIPSLSLAVKVILSRPCLRLRNSIRDKYKNRADLSKRKMNKMIVPPLNLNRKIISPLSFSMNLQITSKIPNAGRLGIGKKSDQGQQAKGDLYNQLWYRIALLVFIN